MNKQYELQLDPESIIRDVIRQWFTILMCAISVAMFTYVWMNVNYHPEYTTKTTIAVTSRGNNVTVLSNQNSAKELATRFSAVLESSVMKKTVREDLGLDTFPARATASLIPETNMIELSITSDSAVMSYKIMDSILHNYDAVADYLIGSFSLEEVTAPVVAMGPSNPFSPKRRVVQAFGITLLLMIAFVGWISYRRDTVKNVDQLADKVDTKGLGVIYHEAKNDKKRLTKFGVYLDNLLYSISRSRKGKKAVSMLIDNPMRSFFYVESNRMAATRVRSHMDQEKAKVLLVTSVMENEGKSTVAANLALGIAKEGRKVLLVDADFRKPSQYKLFRLGAEGRVNLVDYMENKNLTQEPARQYQDSSLYLIANFKRAKTSDKSFNVESLAQILDYYREKMDYIIVDTAPMALVNDTEEMATVCDAALFVIREDVVLASLINDAIDAMGRNEIKVLGCIFNDATRKNLARTYGHRTKEYGGYYGKYKN